MTQDCGADLVLRNDNIFYGDTLIPECDDIKSFTPGFRIASGMT